MVAMRRKLGVDGPEVSAMGLGCWAIGGPFAFDGRPAGWGEVADGERLLVRLADPGAGPHEAAERAESRRRVWAALGQLPPTQRAAVVQRYYLGMTEAEMAEGGALPAGTIKSRLNAARKGLSKVLRPQLGAIGAQEARAACRPGGRMATAPDSPEARRDND